MPCAKLVAAGVSYQIINPSTDLQSHLQSWSSLPKKRKGKKRFLSSPFKCNLRATKTVCLQPRYLHVTSARVHMHTLGCIWFFPGHLPIFNKNLTLLHAGWTQRPSFTCAEAPKGLRELLMLLKMTTRSCASVPITMATECILCQVLGIKHPDNQTHQFPSPSFTHRYLGDGVWLTHAPSLTIDCGDT